MSVQDVTSLILALVTLAGLVTSFLLSKRGAKAQEQQQQQANKLAERVQHFDELESINDRLEKESVRKDTELDRRQAEIERLRGELERTETSWRLRLDHQSQRCRSRTDDLVVALAALRAVVVSEAAGASAQDAVDDAEQHVTKDHPQQSTNGERP